MNLPDAIQQFLEFDERELLYHRLRHAAIEHMVDRVVAQLAEVNDEHTDSCLWNLCAELILIKYNPAATSWADVQHIIKELEELR